MKTPFIERSLEDCLKQFVVESRQPVTVRGDFLFSPDLPAFAGHFPGQPIFPAVLQMALVRLLAGRALGIPVVLARISRSKFKGFIQPEEPVRVTVTLAADGDGWEADFSIQRESTAVASGSLGLRAAGG